MSNYNLKSKKLCQKILFIDDSFVHHVSNLTRTFTEPKKCTSNPVIRADQPWEKDAAFVDSGLVLYDEKEKLFKAWYQGGACYGPDDNSNMCYATSQDGVVWTKPSLGLVDFDGSKDNNIVLMAECMMHDPAPIKDDGDSNPERRFKAIWWGGKKCDEAVSGWQLGHCIGFSPDGIHWKEHPDNPVWKGDAEVAIPFDIVRQEGKHVMYNSSDGHGMRVVARTESDDFINWDLPSQLVFKSDDEDPPGTEMGGLCAISYDGYYIGMLYVIHNLGGIKADEWKSIVKKNKQQGFFGHPIEMNNTRCREMSTELVTSSDGINWVRTNRQPIIPLGPEGSWDEAIILPGRPIVANNKIYIYYTGVGRTAQTPGINKPQKIGKWNVDTGLATLRLDGFVSMDSGPEKAVLISKEFKLKGEYLRLNINAKSGYANVEILDDQNKPIDGFLSHEITEDELNAEITWKGKENMCELLDCTIKLKLTMERSQLYSISILSSKQK